MGKSFKFLTTTHIKEFKKKPVKEQSILRDLAFVESRFNSRCSSIAFKVNEGHMAPLDAARKITKLLDSRDKEVRELEEKLEEFYRESGVDNTESS